MKQNKGFTLIELLVVVAIIGILASVVLASLNSARGKGTDSAIKGELSSLRAQAEIFYDTAGNYGASTGTACADSTGAGASAGSLFEDSGIVNLTKSIGKRNGDVVTCSSSPTAWAVAAKLTQQEAGNDVSWCVDSTGASKKFAGLPSAGAIVADKCI